ncbi:MAG TPA: alpha/beta fold hydrolase [Terracidiphilus sp.]|nr:alpha/beta fold hydrolase [Terracidiphilus sp.]
MAGKKKGLEIVARGPGRGNDKAGASRRAQVQPQPSSEPTSVSGRWLLGAVVLVIGAAVFCAWCALCLLFWQGSWQLLYHPAAAVTRTPASAGLAFDAVGFAATDAGTPRLAGWWIPAAPDAEFARLTVLFLHGQDGSLGDTLDALARLHGSGVNVLAIDYRGYGQSQFVRPSEAHWRQDAEWAIEYLTGTRHVAPGAIVLDGTGLGANLALEVAAAHPELAGVIVESPLVDPMRAVFSDARGRMVPARLLVRDRFDLSAAAENVRVPVLWFASDERSKAGVVPREPQAYGRITGRKTLVWLSPSGGLNKQVGEALTRWLDELPTR